MPITVNSNYNNPQVGQIVSNLAAAIYGDPEARMKAGYYGAETNSANATAAKTTAETTGINLKNNAVGGLPDIAAAFIQQPNETAQAHAMRVGPLIGRLLQAGGGNADQLAGGLNSTIANIFAQGGVDDQARALTMTGHPVDQNFSPTAARADEVAGRNAKSARGQAESVAHIDQAGANSRNNADNQGKLDQLFAAPVVSKPGDTVYLAPNDPRAKTIGTNGVVKGAPTVDTVRAAAGEKIAALPEGQAPNSNIADVFSGKAGAAAAGKPKAVNANSLRGAIANGVRSLNGVVDPSNPQGSADNFAKFEASFPPETIAAAHDAANKVLVGTGNANDAGAAYLSALGLKPGDTFDNPGALSRLFGNKPHMETAQVAPAPVAAAPAAAPVSRDQLPPPEQRPIGKTYPTPKGPMTWTAQGWVPAQGPVY